MLLEHHSATISVKINAHRAHKRSGRVMGEAAANLGLVLEIVKAHPGSLESEVARMVSAVPGCTWSSPRNRLCENRRSGALLRAGVRSDGKGSNVRLWPTTAPDPLTTLDDDLSGY